MAASAEIQPAWLPWEERVVNEHVAIPIDPSRNVQNVGEHEVATNPSDCYKALVCGDWESVKEVINKHPNIVTSAVTPSSGETPLMVAIKVGHMHLVQELIGSMSVEDLALTDNSGNTALHAAVMLGNIKAAELLDTKNPKLRGTPNKENLLPVHIAILRDDIRMTDFLSSQLLLRDQNNNEINPFKSEASRELIRSAIRSGMYDWALEMLKEDPLIMEREVNFNPLAVMAENPIAFHRGPYFNFWESIMDRCFGPAFGALYRGKFSLKAVCLLLFLRRRSTVTRKKPEDSQDQQTTIERFLERRIMHNKALDLLKFLCSRIHILNDAKARSTFKEPFLLAARNGIEEIVTEILHSYPNAVTFTDDEEHSVFHIAVMYRHKNIFKTACQKNLEQYKTFLSTCDREENNILHLAGYNARQDRLDLNPRTFLQMQNELRWFKELEKLVTLREIKGKNKEGKTPLMIFYRDHADLASKEIQLLTGMATACSVASSIIATVAFAAAITVPGGNNSDGVPIFLNRKSFLVFLISDALALFASITCLLSFLSIFTSHFAVDDFLYSLPNRVIIGLISRFFSIICLMVAFSCTLFLVSAPKTCLMLIPIIAFACVPVILYTFLQLPSLISMIKTTYFTRDFLVPKKSRHEIYMYSTSGDD